MTWCARIVTRSENTSGNVDVHAPFVYWLGCADFQTAEEGSIPSWGAIVEITLSAQTGLKQLWSMHRSEKPTNRVRFPGGPLVLLECAKQAVPSEPKDP